MMFYYKLQLAVGRGCAKALKVLFEAARRAASRRMKFGAAAAAENHHQLDQIYKKDSLIRLSFFAIWRYLSI
jgi:hypothetical protein